MKYGKNLTLLPTLALIAVAPLFGQEAGHGEHAEGRNQAAAEFRTPTFVKLTVGRGAIVSNDAGERLGVMRDHVIERENGKVRFIVVDALRDASPVRACLVPYTRFTFDAKSQKLVLPMSMDALRALPEYDPKALQALGEIDGAPIRGEEVEDQAVAGDDVTPGKRPMRYLVTTAVLKSQVLAQDEAFSHVTELLMEPKEGPVTFLLTNREQAEADPYIIPWKATTWGTNDEGMGEFKLAITTDALADAPKLEGGDPLELKEKETLANIFRFYKLTPPTNQPQVDDSLDG